jgi:hypothetical protein
MLEDKTKTEDKNKTEEEKYFKILTSILIENEINIEKKNIYNFYLEFMAKDFFKRILNRDHAYETVIEYFNNRMKNHRENKDYNPQVSIFSGPGGGKTLFLKSIPFYLRTIQGPENMDNKDNIDNMDNLDYLPIYISFNNSTKYEDDYVKDAWSMIYTRILYSFIRGIKATPDVDEDKIDFDFSFKKFSEKISKYKNEIVSPDDLIKSFIQLTGKKNAIILVDEIMKIEDSKLRTEVIKHLGELQDKNKYINVIITTVDYSVLHKSDINRRISYIHFEPLKELIGILDSHEKLKNLYNVQLALIEASLIPRLGAFLFREISNCDEKTLKKYDENKMNLLSLIL